MTLVPELRCNHEESASHLPLHASHMAHRGSNTVVLRSTDSDVAIGYHAFSGCDSTSAFVGHSKAKGYKLLYDHHPFRSTMAKLGKSFVTNEELLQEGEVDVCALYW